MEVASLERIGDVHWSAFGCMIGGGRVKSNQDNEDQRNFGRRHLIQMYLQDVRSTVREWKGIQQISG